jgi:hypothetical protein
MPETELHPDDRVYLSNLTFACTNGSHDPCYLDRVEAVAEPEGRRYVWQCPKCEHKVSLVVPEPGSDLQKAIQSFNAKGETELHPDDGVPLTSVGFFAEFPGSPMIRLDKEVLGSQSPKTEYTFGVTQGCPAVYIVVPHGELGQAAAT